MKQSSKWYYLVNMLRAYRWQIGLIFASMLILVGIMVRMPSFMSQATGALIDYGMAQTVDGSADKSPFMKVIFQIALLNVLSWLISLVSSWLISNVTSRVVYRLQSQLFARLMERPVLFFDKQPVGKLQAYFTNDIENVTHFLMQMPNLLNQFLMLIGTCVILTFAGNFMVWMMLLVGLVAFIVIGCLLYFSVKSVKAQQEIESRVQEFVAEIAPQKETIQSFGMEAYLTARFKKLAIESETTGRKGQLLGNLQMPIVQLFLYSTIGMIIFYYTWGILDGPIALKTGITEIVMLVLYARQIFLPMQQVTSQAFAIQQGISSLETLGLYLNGQEFPQRTGKQLARIAEELALDHVDFGYQAGTLALKDIQLSVKKGEMVALVGLTGSGKTSVLNICAQFYQPDKGRILLDGEDGADYMEASIRQRLGFVMQESFFFSGTIWENLLLGNPHAVQSEVEAITMSLGIHEEIMNLSEGYHTLINGESFSMSAGKRQLLSLARALVASPDLLLLDEVTSNVDVDSEEMIQQATEKIRQERGVIIVAHKLQTIMSADQILVIDRGRVKETGTHKELMNQEGLYAQMYKEQFASSASL